MLNKLACNPFCDQGKIAEVFRDVFAAAAQPNSDVTNDSLRSRFLDRYHNYFGDQITGELSMCFPVVVWFSSSICEKG